MSDDAQSRSSGRPFLASHDDQSDDHNTPLLPNEKPDQTTGDFAGIPASAEGLHAEVTSDEQRATGEVESESQAAAEDASGEHFENKQGGSAEESESKVETKAERIEATRTTIAHAAESKPSTGISSLDVKVEPIPAPMPHYAGKPAEPNEEELQGASVKGYTTSSTKKARMGMLGGSMAVVAIAIGVYAINQDVYSLNGGENESPATVSQSSSSNQPATLAAVSGRQTLSVEVDYLPKLSEGHYQLWLEQDGQTTSLGSFSINDDGKAMASDKEFSPEVTFTKDPASLFVTIESEGELAAQPSASIIATGSLNGRSAELAFEAIDLSEISGSYVLAAPSDLTGNDQKSGLWLAKTDGTSLTGAGLDLPVAPSGWVYEAQLIFKDQIIAMGRFADPAKADSMTKFTPNPSKVPQLPGEDYLQGAPSRLGLEFPTNLGSGEWKVMISLEPDINGSDPSGDDTFAIHLLSADIAADSESYKELSLKKEEFKLPKITVAIK